MPQPEHLNSLDKPSRYLQALTSLEGVPIVSTLEQQKCTPCPHLMLYPDGSVRIFVNKNVSRNWNPLVPLRSQLGA